MYCQENIFSSVQYLLEYLQNIQKLIVYLYEDEICFHLEKRSYRKIF
nr:MAG TPA: hypothetical protein [Caudoviricetes sp.]DAQ87981.1 MAG TPA: hypothetical protein [Caudoviricetes sp.]